MKRDLAHLHLNNWSRGEQYRYPGRPRSQDPSPVPDRAKHAQSILDQLNSLPDFDAAKRNGLYLDIIGQPGEALAADSLNKSDLRLLKYDPGQGGDNNPASATVYASGKGVEKFAQKIHDFGFKEPKRKADGSLGNPPNAALVANIGQILEASIQALWRSHPDKFPRDGELHHWEIWLYKPMANIFVEKATEQSIELGDNQLDFPEDIVVLASATVAQLALLIKQLPGSVNGLTVPTLNADFIDHHLNEDPQAWSDELLERLVPSAQSEANALVLLDTGVGLQHPLVNRHLGIADRHTAIFSWGVGDSVGHGSKMAGIALYGDLWPVLQSANAISVPYHLESGKVLNNFEEDHVYLHGALVRDAIDAVETATDKNRVFCLASTSSADTPHDGAPTSWSCAVDQLSFGSMGTNRTERLIVVSAGNATPETQEAPYPDALDSGENEIESPSQAWNCICVGAYTNKTMVSPEDGVIPVAPQGDLSPFSRTSSWSKIWPIKPDIVLEGGNLVRSMSGENFPHWDLLPLTTSHAYPFVSFSTLNATSAATAFAARDLGYLRADYPDLWPETIRALYVSSARWTDQMLTHLPSRDGYLSGSHNKGDLDVLFKRFGYGVPSLERARKSARNSLTLIFEDVIEPYKLNDEKSNAIAGDMRVFELPWPREALRKLGTKNVKLRIALSTFVEVNPSEAARSNKYRYASHNLRFKMQRAGERPEVFLSRISALVEAEDEPSFDSEDGWDFGTNRRDVGSLQMDQLRCNANDLSERNHIAVHSIQGWWKSTQKLKKEGIPKARFALIVEIDAGEYEEDLYTEVETQIGIMLEQRNRVAIPITS